MNEEHTIEVGTLVVGAGPTGLGAAWRLHERGGAGDWLLVERDDGPGGMSASVTDDAGFTWDLGGHVVHSHYPRFDDVAHTVLREWEFPRRGGWVHHQGAFVPTPVQQHLGDLRPGLPEVVAAEVAHGGTAESANLDEWFEATFGTTLTAEFFRPFNTKMWAHPPTLLDHTWTSERSGSRAANVPQPRVDGDRPSPDRSTFPYPRQGAGALWRGLADRLPAAKLAFGVGVAHLDLHERTATLDDGRRVRYRWCVSSAPLPDLLRRSVGHGFDEATVDRFTHNSVHLVGFGFAGELPEPLRDKTWVLSADPDVPWHRATVLSNSSPAAAGPGRWSVLTETAGSAHRRVDLETLVAGCLDGLRALGVDGEPLQVWRGFVRHGYPVPFLGRDDLLREVQDVLQSFGVRSRGRFGGWRYESCNQDHAFVQGLEAVDAFFDETPERAYGLDRVIDLRTPEPSRA